MRKKLTTEENLNLMGLTMSDIVGYDKKQLKSLRNKIGYLIDIDKIRERHRKYYHLNKEKFLKQQKEYRNNKEKYTEYQRQYAKNRKKTDINYKLKHNLRTRLRCAIKGNHKNGSAVKDLGCTISELKIYLESKFLPGMTWDNWSQNGWHIDHIIPLSSFDLTNREEFLKASHYTNLQPLDSYINRFIKRDKIDFD